MLKGSFRVIIFDEQILFPDILRQYRLKLSEIRFKAKGTEHWIYNRTLLSIAFFPPSI